jgi:hypothetical protein
MGEHRFPYPKLKLMQQIGDKQSEEIKVKC